MTCSACVLGGCAYLQNDRRPYSTLWSATTRAELFPPLCSPDYFCRSTNSSFVQKWRISLEQKREIFACYLRFRRINIYGAAIDKQERRRASALYLDVQPAALVVLWLCFFRGSSGGSIKSRESAAKQQQLPLIARPPAHVWKSANKKRALPISMAPILFC